MFPRSIVVLALTSLCAAACSGAGAETADPDGAFPRNPTAEVTSELLQVALFSTPADSPVRGKNRVLLELVPTGGQRLDGDLEVAMSTYMPAMGHGPSQQPKLSSIEGNRYEFENVVLNMPGVWELHVEVNGEIEAEVVFEFDVD